MAPHASYTATKIAVPAEYTNSGSIDYDWRTFEVNSDIGNSAGYFGWTTSVNPTNTVQITGYPGDKPNYEMWLAGKQVQEIYPHYIDYDVDTAAGQSGAPVYMGQFRQVVAIHSRGNSTVNSGKKAEKGIMWWITVENLPIRK